MTKTRLLSFILDSLKCVKDSSIGEGNFGIVVDKFPCKEIYDVCAKYHKFQYNPNEYMMLELLYKEGLNVPEPLGEWPEHRVFAMRRIFGKTLEEMKELKFSSDVIADIREALTGVSMTIRHNDLYPRNVMIEDITVENGVVVGGSAYVIDFGESRVKDMTDKPRDVSEIDGVMSWLMRRKAL